MRHLDLGLEKYLWMTTLLLSVIVAEHWTSKEPGLRILVTFIVSLYGMKSTNYLISCSFTGPITRPHTIAENIVGWLKPTIAKAWKEDHSDIKRIIHYQNTPRFECMENMEKSEHQPVNQGRGESERRGTSIQ